MSCGVNEILNLLILDGIETRGQCCSVIQTHQVIFCWMGLTSTKWPSFLSCHISLEQEQMYFVMNINVQMFIGGPRSQMNFIYFLQIFFVSCAPVLAAHCHDTSPPPSVSLTDGGVMTWRLRGSDSKQSIQHLRYWIIDRSNLNWLGAYSCTHTESHHQSNW